MFHEAHTAVFSSIARLGRRICKYPSHTSVLVLRIKTYFGNGKLITRHACHLFLNIPLGYT